MIKKSVCLAIMIGVASALPDSGVASTIQTTFTLNNAGVDPNAVAPGTLLDFTAWGRVIALSGSDVGIGGYDLRLNTVKTDAAAAGAPGSLTYPQYLGSDIWPIAVPNLPDDVVGSFLPIGVVPFRQNLGSGSPADGVEGIPLFSFSITTGFPVIPANVTLSLERGMNAGSTLGFSMLESLGAGAYGQRGTGAGDTILFTPFQFTVVPEPSSLSLLAALGVVLLVVVKKRVRPST